MATQPPTPRVVVVVPCFNHGRFVGEAVGSALGQRGAETRVVIVDDGSDDGTTGAACDACAALGGGGGRVRVVHQANAGLPAARNAGARAAEGAWGGWHDHLVFLDADDWIEPEFVSRLHGALEDARGAGEGGRDGSPSHAYCQERLVELGTGVWRVPEWDPVLLLVTNLHPVTALVRREAFEAAGGFDESMRRGYEDWDFWLRLAARGRRGVRVREPLFVWRRHSPNTMVMDAVTRHESLYRELMARHAGLFARHATEVMACANGLLRRADANWLDESGEAIVIRDQRAWIKDLVRERDEARAALGQAGEAEARARAGAEAARRELERLHAELDASTAVRVARAVRRVVGRLPRPISWPARAGARALKRALR